MYFLYLTQYQEMSSILSLIIFVLVLDIIWLTIMKSHYGALVRGVQGSDIHISILPALLSYMCVILGIWFFAIPMVQQSIGGSQSKNSTSLFVQCVKYGGGLGFVTYGIFNFTNMAIFKTYTHWVLYADIAWGVILGTLATYVYLAYII
jgi:uncharacterized membrane protein